MGQWDPMTISNDPHSSNLDPGKPAPHRRPAIQQSVTGVAWAAALALTGEVSGGDDPERGRAACEQMLCRPDLPGPIRAQASWNLTLYARPLAAFAPGVTFSRLPRLAERGWTWFNPSVAVNDDGVHLLVRSSNYTLQSGRRYAIFDQDRVFRTRYTHLRLDASIDLRDLAPIIDRTEREGRSDVPITSDEDCRLIRLGDQWLATATARDRNPDGICQQVLLRLEGDAWVDRRILSAPDDGHQKNWMPFVSDGHLLAVYWCHPLTVFRIDPGSGDHEQIARHDTTPLATAFRGGSQGIEVNVGWLFVIHEVVNHDLEHRVYLHRFIRLDHAFRLTHVSAQFFFGRKGIEFCAGMARLGDDLLISFGVDDEEAWIARLPLPEALALLRPVESLGAVPDDAQAASARSREDHPRTGVTSVTLAGPGTEELIADALRSVVAHVDRCLVIDTGIGPDGIAAARRVAGDRLLVRHLDWPDDFAAARNAALRIAAETGAAWALTVDTDERLRLDAIDIRAFLSETSGAVLSMPHATAGYPKPRIFRLPARGVWVGSTHEYFDARSDTEAALPNCTFDEVAKTPGALRKKLKRDLAILRELTARQPHAARWWYYLGDTLNNLGDKPGAITAFDRCALLDGWGEEAAWARYREATCWLAIGDPEEALYACSAGLACHPGVAELAWLAGYASWHLKRYEDAVRWSELAIVHGAGSRSYKERKGFRNPRALHEGPYDVLRYALRALGRVDEADEAERQFEAARRRLGKDSPGAPTHHARTGGREPDHAG
jgi:tetratricopeptide (TPR) repeat protein/predicted GH43/DUF377 family glycosyl hydrolase